MLPAPLMGRLLVEAWKDLFFLHTMHFSLGLSSVSLYTKLKDRTLDVCVLISRAQRRTRSFSTCSSPACGQGTRLDSCGAELRDECVGVNFRILEVSL